jgi:hypothetical protein
MAFSARETDARLAERIEDYREELVDVEGWVAARMLRVEHLRWEIAELETELARRVAASHRT